MPLSLRVIIAADSFTLRFHESLRLLIEELALGLVPPAKRQDVTTAIYERTTGYVAGGRTFDQGLFEWEEAAVSQPPFPSTGRILLGGAGGGREIAALGSKGYQVVAFEPSPALAEGATKVAAQHEGSRAIEAAYTDLIRAVAGDGGPLADIVREPAFDAIILGWESFSHITTYQERLALLRATRTLAPHAPLLLSYHLGSRTTLTGSRRTVRNLLERLGFPGRPGLNDRFLPWAGFYRTTEESELDSLAQQAGYEVAFRRRAPYGHSVMVPTSAATPPEQIPTELYILRR